MTAYEDPPGTENYAPSMQLFRFLKELEEFLVVLCIWFKIIIEQFPCILKIYYSLSGNLKKVRRNKQDSVATMKRQQLFLLGFRLT